MKRQQIISLAFLSVIALLTGCTENLPQLTVQTSISVVDYQQNEEQIIRDLLGKKIILGFVSLETAVDQYLMGSPIVAVAGCIDNRSNQLFVLVTTPDIIQNQRQPVKDAIDQFFQDAEEKSYTTIELEEKTLIQALRERKPNHYYPNKMNISWFIDRSFIHDTRLLSSSPNSF